MVLHLTGIVKWEYLVIEDYSGRAVQLYPRERHGLSGNYYVLLFSFGLLKENGLSFSLGTVVYCLDILFSLQKL